MNMDNTAKTDKNKTTKRRLTGGTIARRIVTGLLFVIFFMVMELNCNSVWGWILLAIATAGFTCLFELGPLKRRLFKTLAWIGFVLILVCITLVTWPQMKRVPAVTYKNPVEADTVTVSDGKISGVYNKEGNVEIYAGIPYAAPPVGDLRWKEPQDPEPWEGVLKADTFAPMSMQPRDLPIYYSLSQIIGYHDYKWFDLSDNYRPAVSEDSLYLNIWKPAGDLSDLPVLVYIHGGSLQTGQPWYGDYSGENLAKEGVIVVNMGYRLGVFGYLALDELKAESPNGTTGNYGLLDQIKALEWVRDNIRAFGGDPDNVTLAGESAGSASVSALCTSPLAKGLFKRVILESSTVASKVPPHSFAEYEEARNTGLKVMDEYDAHSLSELRALEADKIVGSATDVHHITVDGYALTETPYESYKKGIHNEEAILHGFNSKESGPFLLFTTVTLNNYEDLVRGYFGEYSDELLYHYSPQTDAEAAEMWAEIYGAVFFDYPHYALARAALENGIPAYEYYFSKQNGRLGSWHSGEEIYAYRNIPDSSSLFDRSDRELMNIMSSYFLNFVKTGNPNGKDPDGNDLPEWEISKDPAIYLELGDGVAPIREKERKLALFDILDRMNGSED